jgi:catechol 2,3-dioxygenase-like lactoylglutathione lyase family enzyme
MITGLHHATFISSDLARSRLFYEGVLGLQVDFKRPAMSFEGVWYVIGSGQQIHLMLLPDPEAGLQRPQHGGRDRHVAFGVSELAWLMSRLDAANIRYSVSQSGRRALFCRDPDQNALEFIEVIA